MKSKIQRLSLYLVVFVLAASPFFWISSVSASTSNAEEELSDAEYANAVIAEIMEINALLKPCGLTFSDLQELPVKSQAFYDGLKEILIEEQTKNQAMDNHPSLKAAGSNTNIDWEKVFNPDDDPKISEASKVSASMWGYAYDIAKLNLKRMRKEAGLPEAEPSDHEIYEEAKNMYMSHYVDIKSGPEYQVVPSRSDDGYFAAWITDKDRQQYDIYLKNANMSAAILATSQIVTSIYSAAGAWKDMKGLETLKTLKNKVDAASDLGDMWDSGSTINKNYPAIKNALHNNDDPKLFVKELNKTLALEDYDKDLQDLAVGTCVAIAIAYVDSSLDGLLAPLKAYTVAFYSHVFKDFYDKARWTTLIITNNMRVGKRVLRYFRYEDGIYLGSIY